MKNILLSILLLSFLNILNSKNIYYNGIKLGEVSTFVTLKDGFLKAKITNSIARFLLNAKYIYYIENIPNVKEKDVHYKKDKKGIINILYNIIENNKKGKQTINIQNKGALFLNCDNNSCDFEYFKNNKKEKYRWGNIVFKNKEIIYFEEKSTNVVIK